ncbi:hypothetical protein WA026_001613 [Henosepilachna vigintioctopunctata]|uniref:Uncharacterized protein n=1 Tax=Henosepilachna vigintioctopunctata TaxID=420089 RepID=A0AAW1UIS4_9CUCU
MDILFVERNTCLHYLVEHPIREMFHPKLLIRIMLKYNAEVNIQNNYGDTPLYRAVEYEAVEFITALLHAEASVFIKKRKISVRWTSLTPTAITNQTYLSKLLNLL